MRLERKIREYATKYKRKEIKISTEINNFLNLSNTIALKVGTYSAFGIIYSISMDSLKILFLEDTVLPALAKNKNLGHIHLRQVSNLKDYNDNLVLSVKLSSTFAYSIQDKEYNLLTLEFLSPLSKEIAIKVGKLLDLKFGQSQGIHRKIIVNQDTLERLKIDSDKVFIEFNGSKYKCVIKDLSYSGAFVISSIDCEKVNTESLDLVFYFEFMDREIFLKGKSKSLSIIQTSNGKVLALAIDFDEKKIPLDYTMLIHDYFDL